MPQSLTKLYAHLVFSTKNRQPFLDQEIQPRVHAYLATIIRGLECPWAIVGGVCRSRSHPIRHGQETRPRRVCGTGQARVVEVRQNAWREVQALLLATWLRAFLCQPERSRRSRGVCSQPEEHHRTRTFQEEYRRYFASMGSNSTNNTFGTERAGQSWLNMAFGQRAYGIPLPGAAVATATLPQATLAKGLRPNPQQPARGLPRRRTHRGPPMWARKAIEEHAPASTPAPPILLAEGLRST